MAWRIAAISPKVHHSSTHLTSFGQLSWPFGPLPHDRWPAFLFHSPLQGYLFQNVLKLFWNLCCLDSQLKTSHYSCSKVFICCFKKRLIFWVMSRAVDYFLCLEKIVRAPLWNWMTLELLLLIEWVFQFEGFLLDSLWAVLCEQKCYIYFLFSLFWFLCFFWVLRYLMRWPSSCPSCLEADLWGWILSRHYLHVRWDYLQRYFSSFGWVRGCSRTWNAGDVFPFCRFWWDLCWGCPIFWWVFWGILLFLLHWLPWSVWRSLWICSVNAYRLNCFLLALNYLSQPDSLICCKYQLGFD